MSLRTQLAALLILILGLGFGFLFLSSRYLEDHIVALLPPGYASAASGTIHLLVFGQFMALIVLGLGTAVVVFWTSNTLIINPLRKLVNAMLAFSQRGEKIPLPELKRAPREIRQLGEVFVNFSEKVEAAHKKDVDVSRVKSDFISTAAHQLRTPLTGIRWALEALEKEPLNDDQKMFVTDALDKSHDLVAIVGTLLDISSIESGKYKYMFASVDIDSLVESVVRDFEQLAQKSNVALFYAKDALPLPQVRADQTRIKWVLNNLVENAIRYTPSGGSVRVTGEAAPDRVFIRVHDTGIGIEEKDRTNIFERFYRAGNAMAKENQGNGLGLYIARTIATDHGGDLVFAANTDGPGTTFALSLPLAS